MTLRRIRKELHELSVAFRTDAARAREDGGVGRLQQVSEMIRLRLGPGKLSPEDYYKMRVYRRDLAIEHKREFASQRALGLSLRWYYITHDKLIAYLLMEQEGVRVPQTYAICHPLRSWGKYLVLRNAEQIVDYLMTSARYPLISKPVSGMLSQDVVLIEGREGDSGNLRCAEGVSIPALQFARECLSREGGTVFQKVLVPHPEIAARISDRVCTLD